MFIDETRSDLSIILLWNSRKGFLDDPKHTMPPSTIPTTQAQQNIQIMQQRTEELTNSIAETNRKNMVAMLDAISAELARLRRHLEADDPRLVELFEEARSVRERWARDNP